MSKIRKGDEVVVIAGRDKGKRGTVTARVNERQLLVDGINVVKKHQRPNPMKGLQGGIVDLTNVPNPHQGALRFGLFDVDDFLAEVARDLAKAGNAVVKPCLVMTCCDQVDDGRIQCLFGRSIKMGVRVEDLFRTLKIKGRFERGLISYGPTRDDIEEVRSKAKAGSVGNSKEVA